MATPTAVMTRAQRSSAPATPPMITPRLSKVPPSPPSLGGLVTIAVGEKGELWVH